MTTATIMTEPEATMTMPTTRLVGAVVVGSALSCGLWMAAVAAGPWSREAVLAGPFGAATVLVVALVGVMVMTPWRPRAMLDWWTMWLAATVLRLLLTPVAGYLLYSATSLALEPLCLAIAASYFVTLLAEVTVLQRHVNRVFPLTS